MVKVEFFPIDIDYVDLPNGKPLVRLFGRTTDGKKICIVDDSLEPYFWIIPKDKTSIRALENKINIVKTTQKNRLSYVTKIEVHKKNYLGKEVDALKVFVNHPKDVPAVKDLAKLMNEVLEIKESDIPFYKRYLIDKEITPSLLCSVDGEEIETQMNVDLVIKSTEIKQTSDALIKNPKILAFDIEVYNARRYPNEETDPIVMVAFYGNDFSKIVTWKTFSNPRKEIEFVKDEAELINRFKRVIEEYEPDYLTGYFTDGFDFPYIKARANKHNIRLNLGLDNSEVKFSKSAGNAKAKIKGIPHVDIFKFIKRVMYDTLDVGSFDLDSVGKAILGDGKTDVDINELAKAWDSDNEKLRDFCEYNLNDARLTFRLFNVMMPHLNEFVKMVGQPIYDISRMSYGQLVEWFLIKNAKNFNEICPNRPNYEEMNRRRFLTYEGAFVLQPEPGLYENLVIFDFKSLYPSIIIAHNIDSGTLTIDETNSNKTPDIIISDTITNYYFDYRRDGFIPSLLKDIILRRNRIKEIIKTEEKADPVLNARQYSLKILANSFYGYFGFAGARWYSKECAASITAFGRHYIKSTIEKAKAHGLNVIYSDTDSLAIVLGNKSKKDALDFLKKVNMELPSLMELELEGFYPRGIFVSKKQEAKGAKKKYALIDEQGKFKITGFETIRGDWSFIAKEVQNEVLEIILKENNKEKALDYIKEIIKKIKNKEIPLAKMIIQKQLRKDIEEYESIGPHVAVAQRLRASGNEIGPGSVIRFIIEEGEGIIRDKAKSPEECKSYDSEYYVNNQIIPAVEKIFEVIGISKDLLIHHEQSRLGEF